MSASAPRQAALVNPAVKFFQWKGGGKQGYFTYYDKSIEKKEDRNIKVDLSEGFEILDEDLFSVTGYIDATKTGIQSNEVRTPEDKLVIKAYKDGKGTVLMQGPYSQLKEQVKASRDMGYTKCMYIRFKGELCHLYLSGTAFAAWLSDVQPNTNHGKCRIHHVGTLDKTKGQTDYKVPVFKVGEVIPDNEWEKIVEMDSEIVQPFLKLYFAKQGNVDSGTSQHEATSDPRDTTNWRNEITPAGIKLGEMTNSAILELSEMLVTEGKEETHLYNCVGQALFDYQQAAKIWDQKKDSNQRLLSDYTLAELREALAKIGMMHKASLYVQAAIEAKSATESIVEEPEVLGDDDDIPF